MLKIAWTAGKILLCSGAETYRVEDTMLRICHEGGMNNVAAFCTPSLVMLGRETLEGDSLMYRITKRGTNLTLISEVNEMSYAMPHWDKSFEETMDSWRKCSTGPLGRPGRKSFGPGWLGPFLRWCWAAAIWSLPQPF